MWLSNFPNAICKRDYPFLIVYSCPLCSKLIDYICVELFLGSLFCSSDLCVHSYATAIFVCVITVILGASLVAQTVKNLPAMQETRV